MHKCPLARRPHAGKAKASLNSLKHGERAKVVVPVLPQEDPGSWTRRSAAGSRTCSPWATPSATWWRGRPSSPGCSTAPSGARPPGWPCGCEQAQLPSNVETVEQVCDLGRKLLYNAGPRILPVSGPPWDDNPAAFLCGLESTAEGCRWLLERWTVLGDMLEREAIWTLTDLYRSIRLQGKHPVDAVNDPDLNLQIQAWEMISPGAAIDFWERCYHQTPKVDPGFRGFMEWREIADKPADEDEAMGLIKGMIAGRIERLEELIAVHEEIAGEEAIELADAASFDPGPEAERLRRSQAAKSRELRQTLELFLKMQAAREKRKTFTTEGTEGTEGRERRNQECANEADSGRDKRKSLTTEGTEGTEGRGRGNQECANEANSGSRTGRGGRGRERRRTVDSTTDGTEGGGPRDEAGGGSREGGIGGRAGEGRTIPGRKRITARGAVGGSEEGCGGEKKAASEANLEMIKQLMAQRFSDMPAARGAGERSQIAIADVCPDGAAGEPTNPPPAGNWKGAGMPGPARDSSRRPSPGSQVFGNPLVGVS